MTYSRSVPAPPGPAALLFTWTGATLFLTSLLAFLYLYEVGYVRNVANPSIAAFTFDVLLFTVFALHHSLLARTSAKRRLTRFIPAWLERSVYTWVASAVFLLVCLAWRAPGGELYALVPPWRIVGYVVQAIGIGLTGAGSSAIDVLDLAGVRQVLDARRGETTPRHVPLKTRGLHRIVRHPLYFGWTLFVFGVPTMTASTATFAIVSSVYLVVAIQFEERSLIEVFGDEYREYQRLVRWKLVPGLW